jgi:hypothetical protein
MKIALNITRPTLDPYSKRQYNADVFCVCCGRGIPNRYTAQVVIVTNLGINNSRSQLAGGVHALEFSPIPQSVMGRDSVEWGNFIGSHCAKQLPKTHKISQRRVITAWMKAGQP